jgi:hypothetical protein
VLSDWKLWASANRLVGQHGWSGHLTVVERLLELEATGDVEGHIAWIMISQRVNS